MSWLSKRLRRIVRAVTAPFTAVTKLVANVFGHWTPNTSAASSPTSIPTPDTPAPPAVAPMTNPAATTKYMKGGEVYLHGLSLCPDKVSKIFIDQDLITDKCQVANKLLVTSADAADNFKQGYGIINPRTNAYAEVIATSNNIIYTDENYLSVKVTQNSTNPIPTFSVDDVVYQTKGTTYYTIPNSQPVYSSTYGSPWTTWMNTYAVWEQNQNAGSFARVYPNVTFPSTGSYKFECLLDDYGSFYVDNQKVASYSFNASSSTPATTYATYTAGDHIVSWNCVNTGGPGGFALVITDTSTSTVIFNSRTANSTQLTKVYTLESSFQGRIRNAQYFDSNTVAVLAIKPELGDFNASVDNPLSTIKRIGGDSYGCNVASVINRVTWGAGDTIKNAKNLSSTATVLTYRHLSGAFTAATGSSTQFRTQANVPYAAANTFTISGGSGAGQSATVSSVSDGNLITLSSSITGLTANSRYSIGPNVVDDFGSIAAIFNIPETTENSLKAGERQIIITDASVATSTDNEYLMRASAGYKVAVPPQPPVAVTPPQTFVQPSPPSATAGAAPVVQNVRKRRSWLRRHFDPVAQTFMVPGADDVHEGEAKTVYGMFVSSIDLWFSAKPYNDTSQLPVMCKIVEVETGFPTTTVLAEAHVDHRNVVVPLTNTFDATKFTKFTFPDPVYLAPGKEYAIVVMSESPDYYVMIAELGGYILGAVPPRRVSQQPNLGSFFKSQNASTWTPIQTQDLVFRINKCVFDKDAEGTAVFSPTNPDTDIFMDAFSVHTTEQNFKPTSTKCWFKSRNVDAEADAVETYIDTNSMYDFGDDAKTSLKVSNRRRHIMAGQPESLNVALELLTTDADVSPVLNKETLTVTTYTSIVNDASIHETDISVVNGGQHSNAANIIITISSPAASDGVQANAYVQAINATTGNVDVIVVDAPGSGYVTTPTVTFSEKFEVGTVTANTSTSPWKLDTGPKTWTSNRWVGYYVDVINGGGAPTVSAGSFVVGRQYTITELGTTDFTQIGAASNVIGVTFIATGTGLAGTLGKAQSFNHKLITASDTTGNVTVAGWDTGTTDMTGSTYRIVGANPATASITGETNAGGGNCAVRYITKRVDLADGFDAGDLRVFIDCIRPRGTGVWVYYKAKAEADTEAFESKKWKLMEIQKDDYSVDQHQLIELEFRPAHDKNGNINYFENGVSYPLGGKFKQYAIKIVLTAADTTVTPVVTNMSAIATPSG